MYFSYKTESLVEHTLGQNTANVYDMSLELVSRRRGIACIFCWGYIYDDRVYL